MYERIYGIYDKKAEQMTKNTVSLVMLYPNDAVALRDFTELAQDPRGAIRKYPDDFALVYLGQLDLETGEIQPSKTGMVELTTAARILTPDKTAQLELPPA